MSSILEELTVMREKVLYLKKITGFKKEGTKLAIVFSEDEEEDLKKYNEYNTQFEVLEDVYYSLLAATGALNMLEETKLNKK